MTATTFNTLIRWNELDDAQQAAVLLRPAMAASADISRVVSEIIRDVRAGGDDALRALSARFDKAQVTELQVSAADIAAAVARVPAELKTAIETAKRNITRFHTAQIPAVIEVETQPGVTCQQITRPVASVGLYIPGGSAPLISTVMMLAIPAALAGCGNIVLCSPPPVADEILCAAQMCGVETIYQVGGAQAIAAMAFGTESIAKADKIFGPGNAWVTEAKRQVSQATGGAAIDMPAGPSEVLVIADSGANPAFIAADLLSQAEHGPDSQVVLVTPDEALAARVIAETQAQLAQLSRRDIAAQALAASRIIIARDIAQCVAVSNQYGPEHLIIQTRTPDALLADITSAGSVFLGDWTPESAGDYASGTNHVLPTYGYTATYSALGLADFMKRMTVQKITPAGLAGLAPAVETLAAAELLTAHKNSVTIRMNALRAGEKTDDQTI